MSQTRHALNFFRKNNIPIDEMRNRQDLLLATAGRRCLAKDGEVYVLHVMNDSDSATIRLGGHSGTFAVKWYNPRNGEFYNGTVPSVDGGADRGVGQPPHSPSEDWIVLVEK